MRERKGERISLDKSRPGCKAKVVIVCGGREGDYICVPYCLTTKTKGMDGGQRWKETLLWREGEREGVAEGAWLSFVFPEVRSAGGEKIKAVPAFEVRLY